MQINAITLDVKDLAEMTDMPMALVDRLRKMGIATVGDIINRANQVDRKTGEQLGINWFVHKGYFGPIKCKQLDDALVSIGIDISR